MKQKDKKEVDFTLLKSIFNDPVFADLFKPFLSNVYQKVVPKKKTKDESKPK